MIIIGTEAEIKHSRRMMKIMSKYADKYSNTHEGCFTGEDDCGKEGYGCRECMFFGLCLSEGEREPIHIQWVTTDKH